MYWRSLEPLRRHPTEKNARAAKRAFLFLRKRHHPDQGGAHHAFLRLKDVYDRVLAAWQRVAGVRDCLVNVTAMPAVKCCQIIAKRICYFTDL